MRDHGTANPLTLTTLTLRETYKPLIFLDLELAHNMLMPLSSNLFLHPIVNSELLGGDKEGFMKLPSDKALLSDPVFQPLVEKYEAVCRSASLLIHCMFYFCADL